MVLNSVNKLSVNRDIRWIISNGSDNINCATFSRGHLGSVGIHREFITAAARWIMEAKLWSVLSARMAMRLNSLSLPKKFSMRCRHLYISSSTRARRDRR
jgi:hypothetical protein